MSQVSDISKRYAKALFELSESAGTTEAVLSDLQSLAASLDEEGKAFRVLLAPILSDEEKNEFIKMSFSKGLESEEVVDFLHLLVEKERMGYIFEIITAYQEYCDNKNSVVRGTVRTRMKLEDSERAQVEETISKRLGKKALFQYKEDPEVIGGLVAEVGSYLFDGSLESQIRMLNDDLTRSSQ